MLKSLLILLCAVSFNSLAENSMPSKCTDLSGQFVFLGEWKQLDLEGGDIGSDAAYKARYPQPRFDYYALAVGANQIIRPQKEFLKLDMSSNLLSVDIQGEGVDKSREAFSIKLPAQIALRCGEKGWELEKKMEGGGESVRSTAELKISLLKDASGDLVAEGRKETQIGLISKKTFLEKWIVIFKQVKN